MSDQLPRYEDLEQTDVLPQLGLAVESKEQNVGASSLARAENSPQFPVARSSVRPPSLVASSSLQAMPAKPAPMALEVGGIRGKIADLETKLLETQDRKAELDRRCRQLEQRGKDLENRTNKAEADFVIQTSELHRLALRASDAEQRLIEQRVQLEADIAALERQVVDARTRGDQRSHQLEEVLEFETERAAQSEREAAALKLQIEGLRAQMELAHEGMRSLEERLATQTKSAADISRLYAQQTAQANSHAVDLAERQQRIVELQSARRQADDEIASLQRQAVATAAELSTLRQDLSEATRAVGDLEQNIERRDRAMADLRARFEGQETQISQLLSAKAELATTREQVRAELLAAKHTLQTKQEHIAKLGTELQTTAERVNALEAANSRAEQALRERDKAIELQQKESAAVVTQHCTITAEAQGLRGRLERLQSEMDALQAALQTRDAELNASRAENATLNAQCVAALAEKHGLQSTLREVETSLRHSESERDQMESELRTARAELNQSESRYDETVQAIMIARESIAVREQRIASLEHELRAVALRLEEANGRAKREAGAADSLNQELRAREEKIAVLEQKLAEHMSALHAIDKDIERVNATHPSEGLMAMGYVLEDLDRPEITHSITRSTTSVGRSDSNDIAIDSTSVSRFHARLIVKPEGVWLIDLQSTNGCGVNGRRASRQILCDGDVVLIGHCRYRFSVAATTAVGIAAPRGTVNSSATTNPPLLGNGSDSRPLHH